MYFSQIINAIVIPVLVISQFTLLRAQRLKKRSLLDDFMGPTSARFFRNGNSDANVIQAFLTPNHQIHSQRIQNNDFVFHYPPLFQHPLKFLYHEQSNLDRNNKQGFQTVPSYYPNFPITPNFSINSNIQNIQTNPYIQTNPNIQTNTNLQIIKDLPTNPSDQINPNISINPTIPIITNLPINPNLPLNPNFSITTNVSSNSNVRDFIYVLNANEPQVFSESSKLSDASSIEIVDDIASVIPSKLHPIPEISEIPELTFGPYAKSQPIIPIETDQILNNSGKDKYRSVTPILSVENLLDVRNNIDSYHRNKYKPALPTQQDINHDVLSPISDFYNDAKKQTTHNEEKWIDIPKYYYKPVPAGIVGKIGNDGSKTTFSVPDNPIINNFSPQRQHIDLWSKDSHKTDTMNELPTPNFNNLEDLLNRTLEQNTTMLVYTRTIEPTSDNSKSVIPNGLSNKENLPKIDPTNFLSAPDPQNPPASFNQQPNTLLIDDWLDVSRKVYDELGPEDKRRVYEANKAVISANKLNKFDNDPSLVELKLLKDLYLVADRVKQDDKVHLNSGLGNKIEKLKDQVQDFIAPNLVNLLSERESQLTNKINNSENNQMYENGDRQSIANKTKKTYSKDVTVQTNTKLIDLNNKDADITSNSIDSNITPLPIDLLSIFDRNFNSRNSSLKNATSGIDSVNEKRKKNNSYNKAINTRKDISNSIASTISTIPVDLLSTVERNFNGKYGVKRNKGEKTTKILPPNINDNPVLKSITSTLWSNSGKRNRNDTLKSVSRNNPKRQISTDIFSNILDKLLEQGLRSTIREIARTFGGNAGAKFLSRTNI